VLVGDRHVLTASHVAHCPVSGTIRVRFADGTKTFARVEREDEELDLARLVLDKPVKNALPPPTVAPARVDDVVCLAVAYPARGWNCGAIEMVATQGKGNVVHAARTEHGNSGGGAYVGGDLVGIVTHLRACSILSKPTDPGCGGRFTSLWGRADWAAP